MNEELREDLEQLVLNTNASYGYPRFEIETLVAEPFSSDAPDNAVGLQVRYTGPDGLDTGRWSRFLDAVEARFSSLGLQVHVGMSKRLDAPPSATWILFPAQFRGRA